MNHPLESLRVIPPGKPGEHSGCCASCGLYLWTEGGYRVPGLLGLFCSLLCIECAIAEKTAQTKKIPRSPIGNGARLLTYLKTEAPQLYAKLAKTISNPDSKVCLECGVPPEGKRSNAEFCSDAHRKRFGKSQTGQKCGNNAETPIGKQGLTEAKNRGWADTLSRTTEGLEARSAAGSPSAEVVQ
jgi:hypothetical protein